MARAKKEAVSSETVDYTPPVEEKDEPEVEIVASPEPAIEKSPAKSADEGIAELNRKLKEADDRILKVERERNEAVQRAYAANNEKEATNLSLIESAINQIEANQAILEGNYAAAASQGDMVAVAKIARAMAANEARALQLENGKQSLKEAPRQAPRQLDPVEELAQQLSPRSAAWVRAHPEYATSPKLTQKMIAAHNLAMADGLPVDTDDYFASVEDTLKINRRAPARHQEPDEDDERYSDASRSAGGRQVGPSAIPVSRDITPSGRNSRVVRLTKEEAEIAAMTGQTEREYWENKQRVERERMN
jgi:hypothetical protein